jgi:hypothetical protein
MVMSQGVLPTVGRIAGQYSVPIHRVLHVIRTRGIKPVGRAGAAHVYSEVDAERIGEELQRISERRSAAAMRPDGVDAPAVQNVA